MSQENVDAVRRAAGLAAEFGGSVAAADVEHHLSDAALSEYFDPEIEWVPVPQSLLATSSYTGYAGVRRFWTDFLSAWDEYALKPVDFVDCGDQVAMIMRMTARTQELRLDELWSSLFTLRDGKIVRVEGFTNRDGALEAARLRE
ncbi:MAG TPA: nuclear transport factor 2 family protein [Solirubrobacterales bacterium]|jgi:ketosteroid isomerase-like protein|nr:nuclear transport factor 2 family protein [Solirubrobacterales bacterium]